MKLSEKLAALEHEETRDDRGRAPPPATPAGAKRARAARAAGATHVGRHQEQGPRARPRRGRPEDAGPRPARSWPPRCKSALDQILQREDVQVTPLERRRFVQEIMSDTLGYGPLDPLLADETDHRGHVQRLRRHLGRARGPHRAHRPVVHRRHPVPRR